MTKLIYCHKKRGPVKLLIWREFVLFIDIATDARKAMELFFPSIHNPFSKNKALI